MDILQNTIERNMSVKKPSVFVFDYGHYVVYAHIDRECENPNDFDRVFASKCQTIFKYKDLFKSAKDAADFKFIKNKREERKVSVSPISYGKILVGFKKVYKSKDGLIQIIEKMI